MGFTALDGLPMGTRPGQIDPGVLLYLVAQKGMAAKEVEDLLYRQSGLKGLSGISNDMRELESNAAPGAQFAIDYFVHRIALNTGMLAAALNGLDAFVFTGGIGENSVNIRARVAEKLAWLGLEFDNAANTAGGPLISKPQSRVAAYVIGRRAHDRPAHGFVSVATHQRSPKMKAAMPFAPIAQSPPSLARCASTARSIARPWKVLQDRQISRSFHAQSCLRKPQGG